MICTNLGSEKKDAAFLYLLFPKRECSFFGDCKLTDIAREKKTKRNFHNVFSDVSWPRCDSVCYLWPTHREMVKCSTATPTTLVVEQMQNETTRTTKQHTAEWNVIMEPHRKHFKHVKLCRILTAPLFTYYCYFIVYSVFICEKRILY